jgi:hypothetical protein
MVQNPTDTTTNDYAIEIHNMSFYYGSFRAVKDVTLNIDRKGSPPSSGHRAAVRALFCVR